MGTELPIGWVETPLEKLVSPAGVFSDGDWIESKDQDPNGDVRLIQLADIGEMEFLNKSSRYLTSQRANELRCLFLQKDDLLISRLGEPLGKACLYPAREDKAITAVDVCIFRPANEFVEPKLIGFFLNSPVVRQAIDSQASGTTRKRITGGKLKSLPLRIPPLNEQRRIVSKIEELFSRLDEGEAALKRVQRLLTSYRQAVLKAAVTGELTKEWREANQHHLESGSDLLERVLNARREQWQGRGQYQEPKPPDTSGLPTLPDGWVWATPEQIMQMFGNGIPRKPADYKTNYPILRISAVRPLSVNTADIRFYEPKQNENLDSYWLKSGDLLFTRYNGSIHLVGVCGLYRGDENILHPDKIIKLRTIDFPELCKEFLEICFNVGVSRAFIRQNIKTTAGQQGIAGGDLRMTPFPLPPSAEQFEIASKAQEILSRIATLESWCSTELTRSATLRQSILKAAFSGQLVPQDSSDEPASVLLARIQAERQSVTTKPTRRAPAKAKSKKTPKQPSQQERS